MRTVKDVVFDVLRDHGMTTMFSNPGSTEVPFLVDLPEDLTFVLALHEGSVVGMATGWSLGSGRPGLVLLHTTAGLGNAVGALATARVNRAPMVVLVGQQDRRHVASVPFLTGELEGLAGDYPVRVEAPARAADLPAAVARAHHEAVAGRGPAIVIVPMNDWDELVDDDVQLPAPRRFHLASGVDAASVDLVGQILEAAERPVLVVGAAADEQRTWEALRILSDHYDMPVWQEPFGARAGFPQDHPRFAGHLSPGRSDLRESLKGHDVVLVVGAPALRQYGYEPGPLFVPDTRVVVLTDDASEGAYSTAELAVITPIAAMCEALAARPAPGHPVASGSTGRADLARSVPRPPAAGEPLRPQHVFAALDERLPDELVIVEESPSSRALLQEMVPARQPLGFLSAAMGGLGFAMPAAAGLKMARPERSIVAVVGDGSSLYSFQALWSAQHYGVGVLYVVLSNGGYAIMDRLARNAGGSPPWPSLDAIDVGGLSRSFGCETVRVETYEELVTQLDLVIPTLPHRSEPVLLDVVVSA